jgi:peptidoglycan/LPS O-acetylase OafA/YrhL
LQLNREIKVQEVHLAGESESPGARAVVQPRMAPHVCAWAPSLLPVEAAQSGHELRRREVRRQNLDMDNHGVAGYSPCPTGIFPGEMANERGDIPVLSGIRGFAVLIVFLSHAANIYFDGKLLGWGGGQLGVMLFFMLSGFLMGHLYMGTPASFDAMRRFVVNRLARVYPMFALVVLGCYAVVLLGIPLYVYPISTLGEVFKHLAFVHGFEVLWTIGPEVIFYLLFLLIWRMAACDTRCMWAIAALFALLSWIPLDGIGGNSIMQLHDKLPYFLVGSLMGARSDQFLAAPAVQSRWRSLVFFAVAGLFLLSFPQIIALSGHAPKQLTGDPWPNPWAFPYYLVIVGLFFVSAMWARPRVLTNRVALFAGKISFSFYLLHFAVLKNMQGLLPTHPVRGIALAAIITTVLATLSFYAIEKPARRMLRRLGPRVAVRAMVGPRQD